MIKSAQRGFTLIELVVVIVILGILAAFAVPRFANLDRQARISTVRSLEGTLRSGATLAHAQWMASGQPATVTLEGGQAITMVNGYPDGATIQRVLAQGTVANNQAGRFNVVVVNPTTTDFELFGANNRAACRVRYVSAPVNGAPNIAATATVGNC